MELPPHFFYDFKCAIADRSQAERREQERDEPADEEPREDVGVGEVELFEYFRD